MNLIWRKTTKVFKTFVVSVLYSTLVVLQGKKRMDKPLIYLLIYGILALMIPIFQFIWSLLKTFETKRLMEQLEETADPRKRREIIRAIVQRKSRMAVRSLIKSLQNKNAAIRSGAAEALGLIGSPRAVMPLITIMNRDEEKIVRREVITALGNIRDFEATSPLIKVLEDQDKESRRRGVEALGKIGSRRAD